jgi:uncharacterized surface anchored protein
VTGKIRDRAGTPLAGWTVSMRPAAATYATQSVLTDDTGSYQFGNLAPGDYYFEEILPAGDRKSVV